MTFTEMEVAMEQIPHEDLDRPLRLRPDGSIDTTWYMARGRLARGRQARRLTIGAGRALGRSVPGVLAALAAAVLWPWTH